MKAVLRPWMALKTIEKVERVIQAAATALIAMICALYIARLLGFAWAWTGAVGMIEQGLGILSASLVVLALAIRSFIMRTAEERIAPQMSDKPTVDMLKGLVSSWITAKPRTEYARQWRYLQGEEDLELLNRLNYDGFALSRFYVDKEVIARRNAMLWQKNPRIFAFILDPIVRDKVIGYSCMLPLNRESLDLYLSGGFEDKHVSAIHVIAPGERCAAIVILAIVMDPAYSRYWRRGSRDYLASFISAVLDQASALAQDLERNGCFLAQSEKKSIHHLLHALGFTETEHVSAEGYPFYRLTKEELQSGSMSEFAVGPGETRAPVMGAPAKALG